MSNEPHSTSPPGRGSRPHLDVGMRPVPGCELIALLGEGGYGEVWKAKGPGGFAVALKFIRLGHKAGETELRSLALMKDIRHPHLLSQFGAWQRESYLIVAMELGERTLMQRLHEAGDRGLPGIPFDELLQYMRDAARGLDYLNELGIQHRDIKPQNLLLVGGCVKVADFGLAKLLEHTVSQHSGSMTPAYAAPEFLQNQTSPQSDQYSLAVSYCQLRGGRLPFGGNAAQQVAGHLTQPPDLTMLPEAERPVLARALAKKAEERWPSCRVFVEAVSLTATPAPAPARPRGAKSLAKHPIPPKQSDNAQATEQVGRVLDHTKRVASLKSPPVAASWRRRLFLVLGGLLGVLLLIWLGAWVGSNHGRKSTDELNGRQVLGPASPKGGDDRPPAGADGNQQKDGGANKVRAGGNGAAAKVERAVPVAKRITNSIGMDMVLIPAGSFTMGSPKKAKDGSYVEQRHDVTLTKPFYLGVYEVTQEQYETIMGVNPSYFKKQGEEAKQFPVETVSWEDAQEFCKRLSDRPDEKKSDYKYRLPTEAEWEYACRGGAAKYAVFHYGNALSSRQANFDGNFPYNDAPIGPNLKMTTKVGSYERNAFGLYDMHGNVSEWCQDWYGEDYYKNSPREDPTGPNWGSFRVIRGGGWFRPGASCRAATRGWYRPLTRLNYFGFRVVGVPSGE